MNAAELKKTIKPQLAIEIQQICKPLFYKTPINGYQFTRLYNDNSRIHLGSNARWSKLFFTDKLYLPAKLVKHPSCYHSGAYIWDHWPRNCPSYINCGKIAEDYFDLGHGMTIIHKHTDYCDIFEMSAPKNHLNTDEFYTANIDLLQNYAAYFMEAAEKIITNAEQNKFILEYPDDYDRYHEYEDLETGLIDETKQPLITKSELYSLLTIREKQILAWLFQGKTSAEIAIILGISRRTVEKFIPRLKIKSNCQSLFQLGAKLSLLQYRLMLEEFIMAPNHKHRT